MLVYESDLTGTNATVGNNSTLPVIGDANYDRTVVNDAGNIVGVPAEAVRSHGMRIAENLVSLNAGYCTNSSTLTLQNNGEGEITGISGGLINYYSLIRTATVTTHGFKYCVRLELKAVNPEAIGKKVRFLLKRLGAGTYVESTITVVLTGTYQTYSTYISLNPDNLNLQFAIFSYGDTDGTYVLDTDTISVRNLQIEATETHVIQDKPSEFVSRDVLSSPFHGFGADGYKLFNTTKGTTVDVNGVVTDAVGAPLAESTLLGYVSEGPATDGLVIPIDLEAL